MEAVNREENGLKQLYVDGIAAVEDIKARDIYSTSAFNLFSKEKARKIDFTVFIPVKYDADQLSVFPLFSEREVEKLKKGGKYKYIHFGCFRIHVVPHFRTGINAPLRVGLFDTRRSNLQDALANCYRGNLSEGIVYKDIYPNVSMPLDDAKCWNALVLLAGVRMIIGSIPCSVVVKGVYCLANTESPAPLKEAIARRISLKIIPVTETPEGVVNFTSDSVPRSPSDRNFIRKLIKPQEEAADPQKSKHSIKASEDEN